jgi:N-acetylglucosamine kinase-like BadF-type ATPase
LAAIWRAGIGVGPETSLTDRALERWGSSGALDLLHAFTRRGGLPRSERSLFARAVLDEASAGDRVAQEIVTRAGRWLGDYARVSAERTGQLGTRVPLVLCGGVFRHPSLLLRESIIARVPRAEPRYPAVEPVAGAVLLAADAAGVRPSLDLLRRSSILAASVPLAETR